MPRDERREAYIQKLRDPRWQKMRLKVMERDNFSCRDCTDSTVTLNVHHSFYRNGAEPWDYPVPSLITLCEDCHEHVTAQRASLRDFEQKLIESAYVAGGGDPSSCVDATSLVKMASDKKMDVTDLAWAIYGLNIPDNLRGRFMHALGLLFREEGFVQWAVERFHGNQELPEEEEKPVAAVGERCS